MTYRFEWSEYKKTWITSTKEICTKIRQDLKDQYWKWYKFSVRKRDHNSINVDVIEAPFGCYSKKFKELKEGWDSDSQWEYQRKYNNIVFYHSETESYTKKYPDSSQYSLFWEKLINNIEKIVNKYNFDDSDSMSDYFHCNFYCFPSFHREKFVDKDIYTEDDERWYMIEDYYKKS